MTTGSGSGEAARAPVTARICSASRSLLSEGPRWDAERAQLIWVDILAGEVHTAPVGDGGRLEPVRTVHVGRHVGAAAPAEAGGYVLAAVGGFCHIDDATSRDGLDEAALARQPQAGHVLRLDGLGVTGPPCTPCRGPVSTP